MNLNYVDHMANSPSPPRKQITKGISSTKAPSLDLIRSEVKAALSKVSSSVDLGQGGVPTHSLSRAPANASR